MRWRILKRALAQFVVRVTAIAVVLWLLAYPLRPRLIALAQGLASNWRVYVVAFILSLFAYWLTRRGRVHRSDPSRPSTAERMPVDADTVERG